MFPSFFVVMLGLCFCGKESSQSSLGLPRLSGPSEALVKQIAEFNCDLQIYPKNESILLQLIRVGDRGKLLGEYTSLNGEKATFLMIIKPYHEGNLECVAKAQNNSNIEPTVSSTHYLKVIEPVKGAEIILPSGQEEFFEGTTIKLDCKLAAGNHVTYKWLLDGQLIPESHLYNESLLIHRATSKDSGSYICMAINEFSKTQTFIANSTEVEITVKDLVSNPDISFTILKEDSIYSAMLTCQSTKGTPPITFSLYNSTKLVDSTTIEERRATFKVPLVLGQHLGWFQCQANNGNWTTYSTEIPVDVVPVGGPVTIHHDFDTGENYAVVGLRFYCKTAKGSFPRYQWFLNETLLNERGSFYLVDDRPPEQSILVLSVGRSSAGMYRCEVSDSFDNSTAISSKRRYFDKEVLNRLPIFVVAVVFGCFTVLILLVSICCWIGVLFRRRQYGPSLLGLEMKRTFAGFDGELDLYSEDPDVVKAATDGEFDQVSDASEDEWPQIEGEKKTQKDEPVEELWVQTVCSVNTGCGV